MPAMLLVCAAGECNSLRGAMAHKSSVLQASTSDEGLAVTGRFQDPGFFLGYERGGNRYLEDGLAVGKGDDMVLDIAADDRVSSWF